MNKLSKNEEKVYTRKINKIGGIFSDLPEGLSNTCCRTCFRVIRILFHDPIESGSFPHPYIQFYLF
jgi:hypothetical protein